ncbi:MAG: DUF433 domain-containing protein [Nitrospirae bacterium]|nr:DUF433 domain-containing protein [Nitrospirota bacterium]MBI5096906.1 DUF433 domain-containing protein [Nitrospirota bacterium]
MGLTIAHEIIPLQADSDGVVRVAGTRVTLETVITAFSEGATAEEIAQQYPSLNLADIYAVIGYYLRHSEEGAAYLQQRKVQTNAARKQNELRYDPHGVRSRLMSRRTHQG